MSSRREFLKQATVGAAAIGAMAATGSANAAKLKETSVKDRQRLIAEAHFGRKELATSKKGMAICSHPLATREAVNILKAGGNAADAALCAAVTQTVIEPHMTGITGILSMMYYDAESGETTYVNGNMNAPLEPLPGFGAADIATGRGVGVPGFWGGFEAALARHGSLPKTDIMAAAIRYAREGFETHPFLWGEIFAEWAHIARTEAGREIYAVDNAMPRPGDLLVQTKAADTLERLAVEGNDYFYHGEFAQNYCTVVQEAGGVMTPEDFDRYEARWMEPAWSTYRGYDVAGSPPPDNGGTHVVEALNMLELLDLKRLGPPTDSPETLLQMMKICNLVQTEGGNQNDPRSHPVPLDTIVSKEYANIRFELLQMSNAHSSGPASPPPGSNHITVADRDGNVATIIHSCMSLPWSNGLFVDGVTICASGAHFMRVMPEPGHRATTYVAPNMLFWNEKPFLASGSPSVGLIPNIIQNTTNIVDFGIGIEESVNRPRFGAPYPGPGNMIEVDFNPAVRKEVERRTGSPFNVVNPWNWHLGAFEGIYIDPRNSMMAACGDPRRNSKAEGL